MLRFTALFAPGVLALVAATSYGGYEFPSFIDGCQSADGRFTVTAERITDPAAHRTPQRWQFRWSDKQMQTVRTFAAQGVQGGQIYAQLFIPPGGETFALFNHVTMWTEGPSDSHQSAKLPTKENTDAWRRQSYFQKRLIIYRSQDGGILKELQVADFLKAEEWEAVSCVFNRVHWISDYPGLSYRTAPRSQYAFYQVSPDYSILEFRIVPVRGAKDRTGRVVRVRLTDGHVLGAEEIEPARTPVRPYRGPDKIDDGDKRVREGYVPSLDPVRVAGTFTYAPPAAAGAPQYLPARKIRDGFQKADTPSWLPAQQVVVFTDLDSGKLWQADGKQVTELGSGGRGKAGPDGAWYGVIGENLVAWKVGGEPRRIVAKPPLNDIAIGDKFAYYTTLKDPDKGRLTIVDLKSGQTRVAFDGEQDAPLINPNGVARAPDGQFLYVGISSYKEKKYSGVYRFPLRDDGGLDVATGKQSKWFNAAGPDGIAVNSAGQVFVTLGGTVAVLNSDGQKVGECKVPQGSATNVCIGGADGRSLFVTTNQAIYVFEPKTPAN